MVTVTDGQEGGGGGAARRYVVSKQSTVSAREAAAGNGAIQGGAVDEVVGGSEAAGAGTGAGGVILPAWCSAEVFDWNAVPPDQTKFDLVLACDVLYEAAAVGPVAALVPALTKPGGGRWLLAGKGGKGGGSLQILR